jgi:hypothetical protein
MIKGIKSSPASQSSTALIPEPFETEEEGAGKVNESLKG